MAIGYIPRARSRGGLTGALALEVLVGGSQITISNSYLVGVKILSTVAINL